MNISDHLIKHNIKPSYHRIKVLEYLVENRNHPTVEQIYSDLVQELPTLSKTTVYNTLKLLTDSKLVRVVTIEDNETRYDADISDHGHFKCDQCGQVFDFPINIDSLKIDGLDSFRISERNVYYKGICPECLNKNKKSGGNQL